MLIDKSGLREVVGKLDALCLIHLAGNGKLHCGQAAHPS